MAAASVSAVLPVVSASWQEDVALEEVPDVAQEHFTAEGLPSDEQLKSAASSFDTTRKATLRDVLHRLIAVGGTAMAEVRVW